MDPDGSVPYPQEHAAGPPPEPDESSTHLDIFFYIILPYPCPYRILT
jgi:hypothetical protein